MNPTACRYLARPARTFAAASIMLLAAGCSALKPAASPTPPAYYSLDSLAAGAQAPAPRGPGAGLYSLIANETQAAAGYDSQRILYVRQAHRLEYFAHSEWADPPARMLSSLIVGALERSGVFRAVVSSPGSASGELRLETELLVLQQEFSGQPSKVRLALRAYIAEDGTRRVVATRDLEALVPAQSDDPYGGVQAANAAVHNVLEQLTAFCAQTVAGWQPSRRAGARAAGPTVAK